MTKIDRRVEAILKAQPHLTRAEAIKAALKERDGKKSRARSRHARSEGQKRRHRGEAPKTSVRTVSGGRFSPR